MKLYRDVDSLGRALAKLTAAETAVNKLKKRLLKKLKGQGSIDLDGSLFHARVCRFKCKRLDVKRVNDFLRKTKRYDRFLGRAKTEERVIVNSLKRRRR